MGQLIEGVWSGRHSPPNKDGRFMRVETQFRNWVTADGSPGPTGAGGFKAEAGRYHLYVSLACPWAHRTLIMRRLKGLDDVIGVSVVHWLIADQGWEFREGRGATGDRLYGLDYLHQLYTRAQPDYSGRVSVPVLWDRERQTIVNNELPEIVRMLNAAFDEVGGHGPDYYPEPLRPAIDAINDQVFEHVNNGVYKAGFARSQEAYDEAVTALFETLDALDERLSRQRYLAGDRITEADLRLFTTLVRFDPVYVGHFKCNLRRLVDYRQPVAVHPRAVPAPGHRPDGRFLPHQAALLRQPRDGEPERHRAQRAAHRLGPAARPGLNRPPDGVRDDGREQPSVQDGRAPAAARAPVAPRHGAIWRRASPLRRPAPGFESGWRPRGPVPLCPVRSSCRASDDVLVVQSLFRCADLCMMPRGRRYVRALPLDSRAGRGR